MPQPEPGALRLYYRDDRNVSIPFAWMSPDHQLIALDEGELLVSAPQKKVRRRKDAAIIKLSKDLFSRMVAWMMHCMKTNDERPGIDFHRLLGLEMTPSTQHNPIVSWPTQKTEKDDEFVRRIR